MSRLLIAFSVLCLLARAEDEVTRRVLGTRMQAGQRYTGSNTISYELTTTVRQGEKERSTSESVKRTERFVDVVKRAGLNGVLEIDRSYLKLFSTARADRDGSKTVFRSPLQGRSVRIKERNRRRDVKLDGRGSVDALVRRTVGLEIDWRDIFTDDPVGPGDAWDGDADALAQRLAAYLECGSRSVMKVRYEEDLERDGVRLAKLYVDWTLEGMRDRHLFTKVSMAGDVYFDHDLRRVVEVDLVGNMIVRGAILQSGAPRIVKGEGPVEFKSRLKLSPVEASASGGTEPDDGERNPAPDR